MTLEKNRVKEKKNPKCDNKIVSLSLSNVLLYIIIWTILFSGDILFLSLDEVNDVFCLFFYD
jgi:hypothetical protein